MRTNVRVVLHDANAMLVFCLMAMLCLNVFVAFYRRNLKPVLRRTASMLHFSRLIAAELYGSLVCDPVPVPT